MWTVEMETAWLLERQRMMERQQMSCPEDEAMDDVSFGITGMLYTRSIDARRTPRGILKYRFEDPCAWRASVFGECTSHCGNLKALGLA